MITMPGDIPAARADEIDAVLSAHLAAPSFTISPAHDDLGSNAVVCSPPESVPLRFGDNSYFPHLEAARLQGIEPTVIRQPGIAVDIDIRSTWRSSCVCRSQPARAQARCSRNLACPRCWTGGASLNRPLPSCVAVSALAAPDRPGSLMPLDVLPAPADTECRVASVRGQSSG